MRHLFAHALRIDFLRGANPKPPKGPIWMALGGSSACLWSLNGVGGWTYILRLVVGVDRRRPTCSESSVSSIGFFDRLQAVNANLIFRLIL